MLHLKLVRTFTLHKDRYFAKGRTYNSYIVIIHLFIVIVNSKNKFCYKLFVKIQLAILYIFHILFCKKRHFDKFAVKFLVKRSIAMARKGENIYKRKDGRGEGRYKVGYDSSGKTKYRSVYGRTYSEVKSNIVQKKFNIIKGQSPCNLTIKELSLCWLECVKKRTMESSAAVYISKIQKYILPKLGGIRFEALSADTMSNFISELLQCKLSEKYIADIAGVLKSILKYAAKMYGCADKSCYITVPRSYAIKERILLSHDEEIILFKRLKSVPTETNCTILLALTTGMRIGEICALKWSDIDLKKELLPSTGLYSVSEHLHLNKKQKSSNPCQKALNLSVRYLFLMLFTST